MANLSERMNKLPEERRRKVKERANALIAEEISLRQFRVARDDSSQPS